MVAAHDRAASATVVNQGIHRFLQKPLFVVDDGLWGLNLNDLLQAVVPVDNPSVEVIEVRGGKAAAIELNHGAKLRADDRDDLKDHPVGAGLGLDEGLDQFQSLDGLGSPLRSRLNDFSAKAADQGVQVNAVEKLVDCLGANLGSDQSAEVLLHAAADRIQQLADSAPLVFFDELMKLHLAQKLDRDVEVADALVGIAELGADSVVVVLHPLADVRLILVLLGILQKLAAQPFKAVELKFLHLVHDADLLGFDQPVNFGEEFDDLLVLQVNDDEAGKVDDFLKLPGGNVQDVAEGGGNTLEEPDVADRGRQFNVAHPLASNFAAGDFNAAPLADDSLVLDLLVAAAVAFPILDRPEDALAEEAIALWLEGSVVDRFWLLDFAVGPGTDFFWAGDANTNLVEEVAVGHRLADLVPVIEDLRAWSAQIHAGGEISYATSGGRMRSLGGLSSDQWS